MERERIDPWSWQEQYGFAHAWRVTDARELLVISGQSSIDADGNVLAADDVAEQTRLSFENLRIVLEQGGAALSDVVKLTAYLVGTEHVPTYVAVMTEAFEGHRPAQALVGVTALALPGLLVEVEALAVR